jgi:hypothetical protein
MSEPESQRDASPNEILKMTADATANHKLGQRGKISKKFLQTCTASGRKKIRKKLRGSATINHQR